MKGVDDDGKEKTQEIYLIRKGYFEQFFIFSPRWLFVNVSERKVSSVDIGKYSSL